MKTQSLFSVQHAAAICYSITKITTKNSVETLEEILIFLENKKIKENYFAQILKSFAKFHEFKENLTLKKIIQQNLNQEFEKGDLISICLCLSKFNFSIGLNAKKLYESFLNLNLDSKISLNLFFQLYKNRICLKFLLKFLKKIKQDSESEKELEANYKKILTI